MEAGSERARPMMEDRDGPSRRYIFFFEITTEDSDDVVGRHGAPILFFFVVAAAAVAVVKFLKSNGHRFVRPPENPFTVDFRLM